MRRRRFALTCEARCLVGDPFDGQGRGLLRRIKKCPAPSGQKSRRTPVWSLERRLQFAHREEVAGEIQTTEDRGEAQPIGGYPIMPPVGPVRGLAMAAGKAFIDEDVCAQVTAPSNSKSGRTSRISRMMSVLYNLRIIVS